MPARTVVRRCAVLEVGNIFKLGTKYNATKRTYLDEEGVSPNCDGVVWHRHGTAARQRHRASPRQWASSKNHDRALYGAAGELGDGAYAGGGEAAERIYAELTQVSIEVLYDDRNEAPSVQFNDADLLGIPIRLTLAMGLAARSEMKLRNGESGESPVALGG